MKTQLLSLVLFVAPLMLQLMMSENTANTESSPPSSTAAVKEHPASEKSAVGVKTAPAKSPAPAKSVSRIPAKLAPWFM